MRQRLILIGLVVGLAALIALLARGLVREIVVVPLLYLIWLIQVLLDSVPQLALWILLVVVAGIMALRSLSWGPTLLSFTRSEHGSRGRVETWLRLLGLAARDDYSRWRLAQRLATLVAEALAERERLEPRQVRQQIEEGAYVIPVDVRAYLCAGMSGHRPQPHGWGHPARGPLDIDPARVITVIEQLLRS